MLITCSVGMWLYYELHKDQTTFNGYLYHPKWIIFGIMQKYFIFKVVNISILYNEHLC